MRIYIDDIIFDATNETLYDEHWLMAMREELNQFKMNEVWDLVPKPASHK